MPKCISFIGKTLCHVLDGQLNSIHASSGQVATRPAESGGLETKKPTRGSVCSFSNKNLLRSRSGSRHSFRSGSRHNYRCVSRRHNNRRIGIRSRHCCLRRRSNNGFFFFTTSGHGNSQQSSQENGVFHLSSLYKQYKNPHQKSVRDFGNPTDARNSNKTATENQCLRHFAYIAPIMLRHDNKYKTHVP